MTISFVSQSKGYLMKAIQFLESIPYEQKLSIELKFSMIRKSSFELEQFIEKVFDKQIVKIWWKLDGDTSKINKIAIDGFKKWKELDHFEGFVHGSYFVFSNIIRRRSKEDLWTLFNDLVDIENFSQYFDWSYTIVWKD